MHIVVFPGWYPNRTDQLSGDFIQRHLHAIALNCRVSVIICIKDSNLKKAEKIKLFNGNMTELYCYYPSLSSIKWMDNFLSFIRYNYTCLSATRRLLKHEKVTLVHLYVLQKNQLLGLLLKRLFNIPYMVSEQSTLYVDGQWERLGWLQKWMVKNAFKKAGSFHAVSHYLLSAITKKLQLNKPGIVIPNVVDVKQFYRNPSLNTHRPVAFVHVSNMSRQKNIDGMLQAFARAKSSNNNFILNLVGPMKEPVRLLIKELQLEQQVIIWNERNYSGVAAIMQQSDAMIFFTRYETFGCVIIEANACGLPVIVSDLEVTRELITNNINGWFIENENVQELTDKIVRFTERPNEFDPVVISQQARSKFNYDRISLQFMNWYAAVNMNTAEN